MARKKAILTDLEIKALKAAPKGKRTETPDRGEGCVRGLAVRVTDKGAKSFVLITRVPGRGEGSRRLFLGSYPDMPLALARDKARAWRTLIAQDLDPVAHEDAQRAKAADAERAGAENRFGPRVEEYIKRALLQGYFKRPGPRRRAKFVIDLLRNEFVNQGLGSIPLPDLRWKEHIKPRLDAAIARGSPSTALHLHREIRSFLRWASLEGHVEANVARDKPTGTAAQVRTRDLSEPEIRALWKATGQMGTYGAMVRVLLLTGARRREIELMTWDEIGATPLHSAALTPDPQAHRRVLSLPACRVKTKRDATVPLTDAALAVIDTLPRDRAFPFRGACPVKGKAKLDKLMLAELGKLPPWKIHDLRRVVRTGLSRLGVDDATGEACLGHVRPGIKGVYDVYDRWRERLAALTRWANYVKAVVGEAPTADVVPFSREAGR